MFHILTFFQQHLETLTSICIVRPQSGCGTSNQPHIVTNQIGNINEDGEHRKKTPPRSPLLFIRKKIRNSTHGFSLKRRSKEIQPSQVRSDQDEEEEEEELGTEEYDYSRTTNFILTQKFIGWKV